MNTIPVLVFGGFETDGNQSTSRGSQEFILRAKCVRPQFDNVPVGATVTLQVLRADDCDDKQFSRLTQRIRVLSALEHPNIVRYYGCFKEDHKYGVFHVVVMEFPSGITLGDYVDRTQNGLAAKMALRIFNESVAGLVFAAEHGVIHNNITPESIFICDDGTVKVVSFELREEHGLSFLHSSESVLIGSQYYLAPECPTSKIIHDECSNVFSFAVCMHEALSGKLPYNSRGISAVLTCSLQDSLSSQASIEIAESAYSQLEHMEKVLEKGCAFRRQDRFATFKELKDALLSVHVTQDDPVVYRRPDFQVVDRIEVCSPGSTATIELCFGDVTKMGESGAVDVLVVSAFPDSYKPTHGSLLASLASIGVIVDELAKRKEVDLRNAFSCWLSPILRPCGAEICFKRLLCFEPLTKGKPTELVGDIFRSLAPFVGDVPPIRSVAAPLVATGYQGEDPRIMLKMLVEAAVSWMRLGWPLKCFKIVCLPGPSYDSITAIFQDLKNALSREQTKQTHAYKYDAFISYAHNDLADVRQFESALTRNLPDVRLYVDRKDLNPGSAWQQEIYESLDNCRRIVTFLTPSYLDSKVCLEEYNIAHCRNRESTDKVLLPVYLRTATLPTYMRLLQFWDCRECDSRKIEDCSSALIKDLRGPL